MNTNAVLSACEAYVCSTHCKLHQSTVLTVNSIINDQRFCQRRLTVIYNLQLKETSVAERPRCRVG